MPNQPFIHSMLPECRIARLLPGACSPSIEEGLKAATKDPLWYLSRQWQMGEFRATNGGTPVSAAVETSTWSIDEMQLGASESVANLQSRELPLEVGVENPTPVPACSNGFNGAWNTKQLEYQFAIKAGDGVLAAKEYYGGNLDWFDFDVTSEPKTGGVHVEQFVVPSKVTFKGAPNSRWWRFEDSSADPGDIRRPDLNVVAMVLVEFSMIYGNDWFSFPVQQHAGTVRAIRGLTVIDSFGVHTTIPPTMDETADQTGWSLYTLSKLKGGAEGSDLFFLCDRVASPLRGDPVEDVTFARDEAANLVWAVEHKYLDGTTVVNRDDVEAQNAPPPVAVHHDVPVYRLKSYVPRNWVPYIAMKVTKNGEDTILRRARSDELADKNDPQYKGQFLSESKLIQEEEIPAIPLRLTRHWKLVTTGPETWIGVNDNGIWELVRKENKQVVAWIAREKKPAERQPSSRLAFDYLVQK